MPPRKTPTATLKARGSWLVKHRDNEPQPPVGMPTMPSWLSSKAKTRWKRITEQLDGMGLLAQTDGEALGRWCECCAQYHDCLKEIAKHGLLYRSKVRGDDRLMANPAVAQARQLEASLSKLESAFGLTPAARAGLKTAPGNSREKPGILKYISPPAS